VSAGTSQCCTAGAPAQAPGERQSNHYAAADSWLFADGLRCWCAGMVEPPGKPGGRDKPIRHGGTDSPPFPGWLPRLTRSGGGVPVRAAGERPILEKAYQGHCCYSAAGLGQRVSARAGPCCTAGAPALAPGERPTHETRLVGFTAAEEVGAGPRSARDDGPVQHRWIPGASDGGAANLSNAGWWVHCP